MARSLYHKGVCGFSGAHKLAWLSAGLNLLLPHVSPEEWEIMKSHPGLAERMLSGVAFLKPALTIPCFHHERWDGSGYPNGLAGEQIPLAARIFAVVDVWDALLADRPYRKAWSEERTLEYIRE
ncbi:MAG: HD domain-containing phosphohydrolase [Anaerolineaceae bacterium]|nr:HD domain-containing phosphohydrolase [Anaerolineaceae bacterium]